MSSGVVFDIKEFAVFDGPGIRTTVFLKGCPLRCQWCHNPEGLSPEPQLMTSPGACTHCGACKKVCPHESCTACGACIPACRLGLRRICGQTYTATALAARLMKDAPLLLQTGGGITFSGGEPLLQWPFVADVIDLMPGVHIAIETSGYVPDSVFESAMGKASLIMMDIKLMDAQKHRHYTGVDNAGILRHAALLCQGSTPFIIRIPLIPGVNDSPENLDATAAFIAGAKKLIRVELLPYHQTAGAKYEMAGMQYRPEFDVHQPPLATTEPFERRGIQVTVL